MPTAHVNGCDLSYTLAGEGAAAVYIHGGFASLSTLLSAPSADGPKQTPWEHAFADAFQFLSYDRRGCGGSSSPDDGYDLHTQASDLLALLDHLGIARAHLIGSSAGGPIALQVAATAPERVRGLVLVGTALDLFPRGESGSDLVREHLAILERDGPDAAFDQRPPTVEVTWGEVWDEPEAVARGTLEAYRARRQHWREQAQAFRRGQRVHFYVTELRNMGAYIDVDLRSLTRAIRAPTLVIQGDNDQMVPLAWAKELASATPNAHLEVIAGGSHTLMARSAEARERVIRFLHAVDAS